MENKGKLILTTISSHNEKVIADDVTQMTKDLEENKILKNEDNGYYLIQGK